MSRGPILEGSCVCMFCEALCGRRYRVCGVRPGGGAPLLLYESGHELLLVDEQVNVSARHDFGLANAVLSAPAWDPDGNQLAMLGQTGFLHIRTIGESSNMSEYQHPPTYFLVEWDWKSDAIRQLPLSTSELRPAITDSAVDQSKGGP